MLGWAWDQWMEALVVHYFAAFSWCIEKQNKISKHLFYLNFIRPFWHDLINSLNWQYVSVSWFCLTRISHLHCLLVETQFGESLNWHFWVCRDRNYLMSCIEVISWSWNIIRYLEISLTALSVSWPESELYISWIASDTIVFLYFNW